MRTLNEQIQRLRDALVTCYNAIKHKGGTIPEAGERTLLNMPAAVLSIPQIHGVMTELNVTANGEYLPSDYDADGFSKVTAEFDTSSLPKVKIAGTLRVTNACIGDDGKWVGENLTDFSEISSMYGAFKDNTKLKSITISQDNKKITNMREAFQGCSSLTNIDLSGLAVDNVTTFWYTFYGCPFTSIDLSSWNTSSATSFLAIFRECRKLKSLDITSWDFSLIEGTLGVQEMFDSCYSLVSIIGDRTIDEVISNNIGCFNGLRFAPVNAFYAVNNIDRASLRAVINGLADLTGQTAQTLTLGATLIAKLTEEDIAIAVNKNWTLS